MCHFRHCKKLEIDILTGTRERWAEFGGGWRAIAAGDIGGLISDSETIYGTTNGVLAGGLGARYVGRSTANDRGILASDGIVLHTDAVSNCVERSHSQMSAVTNSVSVSVLHFSAVINSVETSERQASTV